MKRRWFLALEATTYTRIYGQQQSGKYWCVSLSNYIGVKYFRTFSTYENIFTTKKKAN